MSPLVAAMLAVELTAIGPYVAAIVGWSRRAPAAVIADHPDPSVIAHESGHALLAWYCTAVADVLSVNTRTNSVGGMGGHVIFTWFAGAPKPAAHWCRLVVSLAGVAAEMMVVRRASSLSSASDLVEAASLCRSIVREGWVEPPWPRPQRERAIAFETVFVDRLSECELHVMRLGYATARELLSRGSRELARLMALLLDRPVLRGEDLQPLLGPRPIAATPMWLALSGEVRAEFSVGSR